MNRLFVFVVGTLVFWVLLAIPARMLWGDQMAVYSGVAMLLCLVPSALTLVLSNATSNVSPEQQLIVVLGGTGLRMFIVLAGAWALYRWVPYFGEHATFWLWVIVFYLFTLLLEKLLLLAGRQTARMPSQQAR